MQRLKVRNLKAPAGSVLSIGTSGNVTSNVNNTLFGVTSASVSGAVFTINCFGFTSNSNVYLGRTQLVNNGIQGNVLTATANTTISNGVYNINLYDPATGGSAVLPNGVTYANYNAWISGYTTTLLRINLTNLTETVSTRTTNAINTRQYSAAAATSDYGWVAGGGTYPNYYSSVNRLTFSSDTSGYTTRSNMPHSVQSPFGTTDQTTYGWFGGGYTSSFVVISNISRLIFSSDTTDLTIRTTMSIGHHNGSTAFNSSYGWFFGGARKDDVPTSAIQRIIYSQDTTTPSVRSFLLSSSESSSSFGTSDYGWTAGGYNGPTAISLILRLTYSNDTVSPTVRGPLSSTLVNASTGINTNTDGFIAGGSPAASAIHRIQFSNDTATATLLSYNLGSSRINDAAFDNYIH